MGGPVYSIFDIKRYSINDGPGIRITFFFKGCPLSCVWCHNPEGMARRQTRMYTVSKCIFCGACVQVCPAKALGLVRVSDSSGSLKWDQALCTLCGKCAEVCPSCAVEMASKLYTAEEVYAEIKKEKPFFKSSGGGVTFSGGEPLYQGEKILQLLDYIGSAAGKDGYPLHRALDTTLYAPADLVRESVSRCELFIVDLKHMDSRMHRYWCGVPNEPILGNLRMIASIGADYIVRIPYIIGVNASLANIGSTASFVSSLKHLPRYVELLPYHDIGKSKHSRMGTVYNPESEHMSTPTSADMEEAAETLKKYGVPFKY